MITIRTEAQLCNRIRSWAENLGFDVFPEVFGWDLVLRLRDGGLLSVQIGERTSVKPGEQVGIHAKLRSNCDVLAQAMTPPGHMAPYPTFGMVAVPVAGFGFRLLARRLGIGVLVTDRENMRTTVPEPTVVVPPRRSEKGVTLPLPMLASRAIAAGVPSPRVLSTWREKALKFLRWARQHDGRLTRANLIEHGLTVSMADRWFVDTGDRARTRGRSCWLYRLTDNRQALPDHGYEDVYAELCAEMDRLERLERGQAGAA